MVSVIELHTTSHSRLDCGSDHQINIDQAIITASPLERSEDSSQSVWTLLWCYLSTQRTHVECMSVCTVRARSPSTEMWEWIAATRAPMWWRRMSRGKMRKGELEGEDKRRNGNLSLHTDLSHRAFLCCFLLTAAARSYICAPAC